MSQDLSDIVDIRNKNLSPAAGLLPLELGALDNVTLVTLPVVETAETIKYSPPSILATSSEFTLETDIPTSIAELATTLNVVAVGAGDANTVPLVFLTKLIAS